MSADVMFQLLAQASGQTLYMVVLSTLFAVLLGLPLGVAVYLTAPGALQPHKPINQGLGAIINVGRSVPFVIMLVVVAPLTRVITGTTIGASAAIVPLTLSAAPFLARLVETSLREIQPGKIEAVEAMGASTWQLVKYVLLPEALPGLISAITTTFISLIGYSAMSGAIGGGGLGDVAIRYGYQRKVWEVTLWTVVLLVGLTQLVQLLGDRLARKLSYR